MEPEELLPPPQWTDETDSSLPGLRTRRYFQEKIADDAARVRHFSAFDRRPHGPSTGAGFMLFGLDHLELLKLIHGEGAAELALKHLAQLLLGQTRAEDMVVRWGESEFLAFLPRIENGKVRAVAAKIRAALRSQIFPLGASKVTALSVSVGTSFLSPAQHSRGSAAWREVIAAAETALAAVQQY
jgi:diguanylate cyclase (GGDEF)-like protein